MTMAKTMPRQPGKRRQGRVGKGDVQFGQTKRKGALICFILVDITPICRIHSGAEPPRHWFCSIGPLAKKRIFTIMALDWHITIITNQFGQNH